MGGFCIGGNAWRRDCFSAYWRIATTKWVWRRNPALPREGIARVPLFIMEILKSCESWFRQWPLMHGVETPPSTLPREGIARALPLKISQSFENQLNQRFRQWVFRVCQGVPPCATPHRVHRVAAIQTVLLPIFKSSNPHIFKLNQSIILFLLLQYYEGAVFWGGHGGVFAFYWFPDHFV